MAAEEIPGEGAPGSRICIRGRGEVEYDASGKPVKAWTRYGDAEPNPWLNVPLPNMTYEVGASLAQRRKGLKLRHIFATTVDGSTECAEAVGLSLFRGSQKGARWDKRKVAPTGFPEGDFDRGHLIAAQFGAGMESINLVSMPLVVNRSHTPATAKARGFASIAELGERYRNDDHPLKGTLTLRGEIILPNYRLFEQFVREQAEQGQKTGYEVSLRVKPATVNGITDVLHAELWLGDKPIRYVLDNDLER